MGYKSLFVRPGHNYELATYITEKLMETYHVFLNIHFGLKNQSTKTLTDHIMAKFITHSWLK